MHITTTFDYPPNLLYTEVEPFSGPRIRIISKKQSRSAVFSAAVTVGLGGSHVALSDGSGQIHKLPNGMAHFMEHLFFKRHWESLTELRLLGTTPNAVVHVDSTTWHHRGLMIHASTSDNIALICNVVQRLYSAAIAADSSILDLRREFTWVRRDIGNEINGRTQRLDYAMHHRLLEALYYREPIRTDMLGTVASIDKIDTDAVQLSLEFIRANVISITILGASLPEELPSNVERAVKSVKDKQNGRSELSLLTDADEPHNVVERSATVLGGTPSIKFLAGMKLPPLNTVCSSSRETARKAVAIQVAMSGVGGPASAEYTKRSRVYMVGGGRPNCIFFGAGDVLDEITRARDSILKRLRMYVRLSPKVFRNSYVHLLSNADEMMRLSRVADLLDCRLSDLLEAYHLDDPADVRSLVAEVSAGKNNMSLVYAGKYVGMLD